MATLNKLAYQVTSSFDRGEDLLFTERVKDLIIQVRNQFVHRQIDKYGVDYKYVQPYIAELELVNASTDVNVTSRHSYLKTVNKIPSPIRFAGDSPFTFVGSIDRRITFRYIKPYIVRYLSNLKYIGNGICYFYIDGDLYVPNSTKLERLLVETIYEQLDVTQDTTDPTGLCYKNNMEFPLSGDMLNDVIKEVINIVRNTQDSQPKNPITTRDIQ